MSADPVNVCGQRTRLNSPQGAAPAAAETKPAIYRVCRVGTLLWKLPEAKSAPAMAVMNAAEKQRVVDELCDALNKDTRVMEVTRPTIKPEFSGREVFYPDWARTDEEGLLTGSDAFEVMSLSAPILFKIQVPKKNQPHHHGYDDVPAEEYYISWSGITAFVLWEQNNDDIPMSGGHVAADVLRTALASTKADLYIQACEPDCDNVFFHTSMRVSKQPEDEGETSLAIVKARRFGQVDVLVPSISDNFEILNCLNLELGLAAERFAKMKNSGRRVMDIESSIRGQLSHLLGHYYAHASIAARPLRKSLRDRWRNRGWRREARKLLAGLWLSLANIEGFQRKWADSHRDFEYDSAEGRNSALFEVDYTDDVATIKSLEVGHLDSTVEQIARSLENRAIVLATLGGALAGGLAGALVGLIH